jgi:hypothetical protein
MAFTFMFVHVHVHLQGLINKAGLSLTAWYACEARDLPTCNKDGLILCKIKPRKSIDLR